MSATAGGVEQAAIQQYCKALRTPTIGTQFAAMAEQAQREEHTYTRYLEALLAMEVEERERNTVARRIQAARFPRMKTLDSRTLTSRGRRFQPTGSVDSQTVAI